MPEIITSIDESPVLETSLELPYTLTTGEAVSVFVAELGRQRITGSRCAACERVVVPAQDYCVRCGAESAEYMTCAPTGAVTAVTRTAEGTLALIRLDGTDADLLHRLDESDGKLQIGDRVEAIWAEVPQGSIRDIVHFARSTSTLAQTDNTTLALTKDEHAQLVPELAYSLSLPYRHSYGPNYGRLFDELGANGRLVGSKCPRCENVLVPPREYCDVCYVRTEQFVDVKDTGRLQAFAVIHMEFVGQTRKPPYIYAEVVLDGSATRLIHCVDGIDVTQAAELLTVGMPVRAVWRDAAARTGTLNDIQHFQPYDTNDA